MMLTHEGKFSSACENESIHFTSIKNKEHKSFNYINTCKKKAFDKIQHPCIVKIPSKLKIKGNLLT